MPSSATSASSSTGADVRIPLDLEIFERRWSEIGAELAEASPLPTPPTVVVVSKYLEPADTRALRDAGYAPLGENRAPDLADKAAAGIAAGERGWHFIGHLQRNKVNKVLPLVDLVHAVDSERLATAIDRWAGSEEETVRALVEVNVSGEESKGGLTPEAALAALPEWAERFAGIEFAGLMTMAPFVAAEETRPFFRGLRELRDRIRDQLPAAAAEAFTELSMGMSNDYRVAASEGATIVRIGRTLYEG